MGHGGDAADAVAKLEDAAFPWGEAFVEISVHLGVLLLAAQILQKIRVIAQHIHQGQGAAVPAGVNVVRQGNILGALLLAAEMHQYLILHAAGGIGGKAGTLGRVEGGDPLDQPNGADGDQVLLIRPLGIVFLGGLMPVKVACGA